MKNGLNKFAKGLFAIFTIKIFLFGLIFMIQACENNINEPENLAKDNFLSALRESSDKINNISVKEIDFSNVQARDLSDGTLVIDDNVTKLCLDEPIDDSVNTGGGLSLGDVIALDINIIKDNDSNVDNNGNYCYEIDEDEASEILSPVLIEAKNYLYTKGFTNQELNDMVLESNGSQYDLVTLVMGMTAIENNNSTASLEFPNLLATSVYAQVDFKDFVRCGIVAIGADFLYALGGSNATKWTKSAIKTAFRSIAPRFLGPIGVAIAVGTFAICMSEAYLSDN